VSDTAAPQARLKDWVPDGELWDTEAILDRFLGWVGATGLEPYPAQEDALLEIASGNHVVLSTPTGSGKSLVAQGMHFQALCEGRRSFYTAPIKALVSEKFFSLCDEFGAESVGMLTGDASINWGAPIICCTAEVLSNMAIRQGEGTDAPYVIMDEFHYYADRDRGVAWQIPLIVLRRSQFLLMSATLGNTGELEERLHSFSGREVVHVHSDDRPVPLDYEYRETPLHESVETLLGSAKAPIYIVHFTQRDAAEAAQALTSAQVTDKDEKRKIAEALGGFRFDTPYGPTLKRILRHGIGLHHAGLLPKYRLLVEQLAQQGLLKVICGTDTLGVGVNIPIRTVLFSRLCKYDGEKTAILSARDFKQISGRAGRRGFDVEGSVVCQAPEHVIENKRLEAKAAARSGGGRAKFVRKKPPTRGFVSWTKDTFEKLIYQPPETLKSRFRVDAGMLVGCLQSEGDLDGLSGYARLAQLIDRCHEDARKKRAMLRESAQLFRSLRQANVVTIVRDPTHPTRAQISEDLQREFSLHHTLSLYLVEACDVLDPDSPTHALDVLSLVEAILENPRALLMQQLNKLKGELVAQLKAERVPYEERMEKLEELDWPKPNADFIYATFNLFAENHPWIGSESIRPKSIAREMFEHYWSFHDFVKHYEMPRMEGVLLRYLSQVHNAIGQTVPVAIRSDELRDVIGYLRAMLARVDSSLVEEWESLVNPEAPSTSELQGRERQGREVPGREPPHHDLAADPRALEARVRAELHQLVRALAAGDFEEATLCVLQDPNDPWNADRFEAALSPFLEEYERVRFDPAARQSHLTLFRKRGPRRWDVHQVLIDDRDDNLWNIEGEVNLEAEVDPGLPLVRMRGIRV